MPPMLLLASCLLAGATAFLQHRLSNSQSIRALDPPEAALLGNSLTRGYCRRRRKHGSPSSLTTFDSSSFLDLMFGNKQKNKNPDKNNIGKPATTSSSFGKTVQEFVQSWNQGDLQAAVSLCAQDCTFEFADFYKPCVGVDALERRLRLLNEANGDYSGQQPASAIVVDKLVSNERAAGLLFHREIKHNSDAISYGRGAAFFVCRDDGSSNLIQNVFWVKESAMKGGEGTLKLLQGASKVIDKIGINPAKKLTFQPNCLSTAAALSGKKPVAPVQYFDAWNRRDIKAAIDLFDDRVLYDDTAFPNPFTGKEALKKHLLLCAQCFPDSFTFEVDNVVADEIMVCVKWHVEKDGEPMPFTRGCSFYEIYPVNGKIRSGIDFLEPAVIKPGGFDLFYNSLSNNIAKEPARLVPLAVWVAYMWIVFFSDGILPGANALALEQRTWEEVRDLSLNFFFVSPLLGLPFAPVVHPMLEGVFNLLLSWAAMFAGFLSDDRKDKPNLFPMLPAVVGMQLLTSAFLLPYLFSRSTESRSNVTQDDLSPIARATESPLLGVFMGGVGSLSIAWAFLGRQAEFGATLSERWSSFAALLSIDRVGSSFLVDLAIFGLFQFWLMGDDLKRRGSSGLSANFLSFARYVPFFGMAAYLILRPSLPMSSKPST